MNHAAILESTLTVRTRLEVLRTELADLAYDLERQGRVDAADVVMQIDTRVRELAEATGSESPTIPSPL